jgi:hypothetical protein
MKYISGQENAASIIPLILCLIIGALLYDRKRLTDELKRKDEKIEKIVDEYFKGNMTLTEALNSLKLVLFEIKGRLK